ncbi:MAG: PIN domain-containing protein [Gemmatimonadaceae bacterium]|nr:PIN domain-containing protein [Gemmatimonadaceae bacterium]
MTTLLGQRIVTIHGNRSDLRGAMLQDFPYVVEADGFRLLDLDAATAIRAGQLEGEHRDPFDRLIAAQALVAGAAVVTNYPAFAAMGVEVLW